MESDMSLKATDIKCAVCNQFKGILVKIETSVVDLLRDKWVHVQCINWIPQLKFKNTKTKKDIVFFDNSRINQLIDMQGKCDISGFENGLVVNCDYINCKKKYTPRCMA